VDAASHRLCLGVEITSEVVEQFLRWVQASDLVAVPRQSHGLGALPAADIQHP